MTSRASSVEGWRGEYVRERGEVSESSVSDWGTYSCSSVEMIDIVNTGRTYTSAISGGLLEKAPSIAESLKRSGPMSI